MARTLVIGGTLFIGKALVEQLLARGDDVTIMHRGASNPFGDRVRSLRCDRNDVEAVRAAVAELRFDVVYDNVYDWARGTSGEQVLEAARASRPGLRCYVFTSSVAAYPSGGPYDEDAPLTPSGDPNAYAAQKADSERALFAFSRETGVRVATLRPAFIYGPHNPFDREAFFWDRLRADRPIIVPDDGARSMQWVHVDDVARAAILAGEGGATAARAYNLGTTPVTQLGFLQALARAADRELRVVHIPRDRLLAAGGGLMAPPFYFGIYLDLPSITMHTTRVRTELGLELQGLDDGLRETFRWYERQERPVPDYTWEDAMLAGSA